MHEVKMPLEIIHSTPVLARNGHGLNPKDWFQQKSLMLLACPA